MAASVAIFRLFVLTMVGSYTPAWRLSRGLPLMRSRPILCRTQNRVFTRAKATSQNHSSFPLAYWNWQGAFSQDSPLEVLALGVHLSLVVEGAQLGHQIGGVLRRVHRQRLWDDEEGAGELGDGQLLPGALGGGRRYRHLSTRRKRGTTATLRSEPGALCSPCWWRSSPGRWTAPPPRRRRR